MQSHSDRYNTLDQDTLTQSVVKIETTATVPSYLDPATKNKAQERRSGSGFIYRGYVITNAHVARFGTSFTVTLAADRYRTRKVTIKYIADDCDLAVLHIRDSDFWRSDRNPRRAINLELSDHLPRIEEKVKIAGFPLGRGQFTTVNGAISSWEVAQTSHDIEAEILMATVDGSIHPGNSGGPVLSTETGKVVGIVNMGNNILKYMIPAIFLKRLFNDVNMSQLNEYVGIPEVSMTIQTLQSPILRAHYNMSEDMSGVRVNTIDEFSAAQGYLRRGDILCAINDNPINNEGLIHDKEIDAHINYTHEISKQLMGEPIAFDIYRDNMRQQVLLPANRPIGGTRLIRQEFAKKPRYFMRHGAIIEPLTLNISLAAREAAKDPKLPLPGIVRNYQSKHRTETLLLRRILASHITDGYNHYVERDIATIDGHPRTFSQAWELFKDATAGLRPIIIMLTNGEEIVLNRLSDEENEALIEANDIICPFPYFPTANKTQQKDAKNEDDTRSVQSRGSAVSPVPSELSKAASGESYASASEVKLEHKQQAAQPEVLSPPPVIEIITQQSMREEPLSPTPTASVVSPTVTLLSPESSHSQSSQVTSPNSIQNSISSASMLSPRSPDAERSGSGNSTSALESTLDILKLLTQPLQPGQEAEEDPLVLSASTVAKENSPKPETNIVSIARTFLRNTAPFNVSGSLFDTNGLFTSTSIIKPTAIKPRVTQAAWRQP